jgi:NADH:ubiquinone oxidoreductase subunit K
MQAVFPLALAALLFCTGIYGVLARRNAVLVLMSVEMMLASVTINLVAFGALAADAGDVVLTGQIFALFVIAIGAAEVGVGLAIILLLYRNRATVNIDDADLLKY